MPDWMSEERKNLIRFFGADIHLVSAAEGGFLGSIARAEALAADARHAFLPRQFSNEDNCEAHATTTGPEIWLAAASGTGSGPTRSWPGWEPAARSWGPGATSRHAMPALRVHPLEPASSPTLTTGHKVGKHRIQGISDEFIPPIVDLGALDRVIWRWTTATRS